MASPTYGHEIEQTPADSEGQGSLACCSPWGCKESDTSEWLNNNKRAKEYPSLRISDTLRRFGWFTRENGLHRIKVKYKSLIIYLLDSDPEFNNFKCYQLPLTIELYFMSGRPNFYSRVVAERVKRSHQIGFTADRWPRSIIWSGIQPHPRSDTTE